MIITTITFTIIIRTIITIITTSITSITITLTVSLISTEWREIRLINEYSTRMWASK